MHIPQLTSFFQAIASDDRIGTTHIAIYMALFEVWNQSQFASPISISRSQIMRMTKICGRTTYHNHMKDLCEYGYIKYLPSYHPVLGSLVWMHVE